MGHTFTPKYESTGISARCEQMKKLKLMRVNFWIRMPLLSVDLSKALLNSDVILESHDILNRW